MDKENGKNETQKSALNFTFYLTNTNDSNGYPLQTGGYLLVKQTLLRPIFVVKCVHRPVKSKKACVAVPWGHYKSGSLPTSDEWHPNNTLPHQKMYFLSAFYHIY